MKHRNIQFKNHSIQFNESEEVIIDLSGKTETFTLKEKPAFNNATGESVIEVSGLATDGREDRSWAIAYFEPNGSSSLHVHNDRIENYYVTSGKALVILGEESHILTQGESIDIPAKTQHQVFCIDEEKLELVVLCSPSWIFNDYHPVKEPSEKVLKLQENLERKTCAHQFTHFKSAPKKDEDEAATVLIEQGNLSTSILGK